MTDLAHLPGDARAVAVALDLAPLDHEGGLFRQNYVDEHSTAIYYLLADPDFSALHILDQVEVYHWYAGAPLRLCLLFPDGSTAEPVLGPDIAAGQVPQFVVPAGVWQGSSSAGEWTLVGTTMAPGFDWEGFRLGDRAELAAAYPAAVERIATLVRDTETGATASPTRGES